MDADGPAAVVTVVTLTVWGVRPHRIPAAIARMGLDRRQFREVPGLRFAKLLGTGDGRTFTLRDADPLHWGLLTVWDNIRDATEFAGGKLHQRWNGICDERLDVLLSPLASRGHWAGREPFGPLGPTGYNRSSPLNLSGPGDSLAGPVASITRARLRPARALSFWRAVPPVSADLAKVDGLGLAIGIGEAPIGVQGTFSLWRTSDALNEFAYRRAAHREVVKRTAEAGWYAEELFARFAVRSVEGTFAGRRPLAD